MQLLNDRLQGRENRWALVEEFACDFLRSFTPVDRVKDEVIGGWESALGLRLPKALVEFYSLCGSANDIWSNQDELLHPPFLTKDGTELVFWVENQACWRIGVRTADLNSEDPPVVWDGGGSEKYTELIDSVSRFALNMTAWVVKFSRESRWGYSLNWQQTVENLRHLYGSCELQRSWVFGEVHYFQDPETFVEVNEDDYVFAKFCTPAAASRFNALLEGEYVKWDV